MDTSGVMALVLAAGKGTRMKSAVTKVMHNMSGKPLIGHVLTTLETLPFTKIGIVVGHGRQQVESYLAQGEEAWLSSGVCEVVVQEEQWGTGHAVQQALPLIPPGCTVMVVSGDQPLLTPETLGGLLAVHQSEGAAATVLTAHMEDPSGLGRIVRDRDSDVSAITRIVEEKDADDLVRGIKEINTGTYCFDGDALRQALAHIRPDNAQKEYYLTDVFGYLSERDMLVAGYKMRDAQEAMGINDHCQLAAAEEFFYDRIRRRWMKEGVKMVCPGSILIDADVRLEADVTLLPNTWLRGNTSIKKGSVIGPQTSMMSCQCGESCVVSYSVAEEAVVGEGCLVGPFSRLRKGCVLEARAHIGNFVEIKNTVFGCESKANHLTYIGDAEVGEHVNVGAGTITCNYDGTNKHKTVIGDRAFIGSNANLVAPVSVGPGAVIGAGSTVTRDVPEGALAVERADQKVFSNWETRK
ncbi:MAG: bifunctional UDP-N-acetylglucosamine diphosphorylase/glucosamine-1-phosphate N-acetyltransferase GlmU [Gracilibacteraceae bacterium]|jgi:bifunctional UDP-N-acetylglucosamine pyrophosphorylase/glucosamine-1-phosphate N-acetyltransferase|nr:bifunctional UDP-N-acetylglucosamine diphosphorylase/glucosamine-1-phosphate N-acetyltransferase GlmU [Gracilibacteraceae bacterium]